MTIPNPEGVVRCIRSAMNEAQISPSDIDLISGHLTSTIGDAHEVRNWKEALNVSDGKDFPFINAPKSMLGHLIGASGSAETIACVLQLYHGFVHPSINCSNPASSTTELIDSTAIPQQTLKRSLKYIAKASFGFGDVNACLVLRKV